MSISLDEFYKDYLRALEEGNAALFAGAGLSKPVGMADWRELLSGIAQELGLTIDERADLLSIAQYHVNRSGGNRSRLNQKILEEFTQDVKPTENHHLIADLSLAAIWTTNYDRLIEDTARAAGKRADVKVAVNNLKNPLPYRDVLVYKMHGDVSDPDNAVLTRDDYAAYHVERQPFLDALKVDMTSKRFLFLGFSFTDPNIEWVLHRLRLTFDKNTPHHFCIMRRPQRGDYKLKADFDYDLRLWELRCEDLSHYGIHVIPVNGYEEITSILRELKRRSRLRDILVSGSAFDFAPLGRQRVDGLCHSLGREIIKRKCNLISGFGLGIGSEVIAGAMEEIYNDERADWRRRTTLRPFPQSIADASERRVFFTRYRRDMISNAGFCVFLCGNKDGGNGQAVIPAAGVMEEFEIAKEMGKCIVPIGATGHAALQIWQQINANLDTYYPGLDLAHEFQTLGDESNSNEQIVAAVFAVIAKVTGPQKAQNKPVKRHH